MTSKSCSGACTPVLRRARWVGAESDLSRSPRSIKRAPRIGSSRERVGGGKKCHWCRKTSRERLGFPRGDRLWVVYMPDAIPDGMPDGMSDALAGSDRWLGRASGSGRCAGSRSVSTRPVRKADGLGGAVSGAFRSGRGVTGRGSGEAVDGNRAGKEGVTGAAPGRASRAASPLPGATASIRSLGRPFSAPLRQRQSWTVSAGKLSAAARVSRPKSRATSSARGSADGSMPSPGASLRKSTWRGRSQERSASARVRATACGSSTCRTRFRMGFRMGCRMGCRMH